MFVQTRAAYAFSPAVQPAAGKRMGSFAGFGAGKSAAEKTEDLQARRQRLQDDLLLTQAVGTDGAGAVADRKKLLEAELKEVSAELRTAKASDAAPAEGTESPRAGEGSSQLAMRRRWDTYEPGGARREASPGAYQVKKEGAGYSVLFQPCTEE